MTAAMLMALGGKGRGVAWVVLLRQLSRLLVLVGEAARARGELRVAERLVAGQRARLDGLAAAWVEADRLAGPGDLVRLSFPSVSGGLVVDGGLVVPGGLGLVAGQTVGVEFDGR
jgi:hypothetical protein